MSTIAVTADDVWDWLCELSDNAVEKSIYSLAAAIPMTEACNAFWLTYVGDLVVDGAFTGVEDRFMYLLFLYQAIASGDLE